MFPFPTDPVEPDWNLPDYNGPYSAENNGLCAEGHPVNGFGRCENLNDYERSKWPAPAPAPTPE